MRNEDKARAHLQSAMKYLGFGMTPDEEMNKAGEKQEGYEEFAARKLQEKYKFQDASDSDVVKRAAQIRKGIDALLAKQLQEDAQQARQMRRREQTGPYWPGQSEKSQKHIKDNYLKEERGSIPFDPFEEED